MSDQDEATLLWTEIDMCERCTEVKPYICHTHAIAVRKLDEAPVVTDMTGDAA